MEVKCQYCFKDGLPDTNCPKSFCLTKNKDGGLQLSREHTYNYQVQVQLNVCNLEYGDFVVWTENGLTLERITRDQAFYENAAHKVEHFFIYGVLPEIIGKWYTRKPIADASGVVHPPQIVGETTVHAEEEDSE